MKREEMSRKSELARGRANSSTSSAAAQHPSELLLSVDQLDERLAHDVGLVMVDVVVHPLQPAGANLLQDAQPTTGSERHRSRL